MNHIVALTHYRPYGGRQLYAHHGIVEEQLCSARSYDVNVANGEKDFDMYQKQPVKSQFKHGFE